MVSIDAVECGVADGRIGQDVQARKFDGIPIIYARQEFDRVGQTAADVEAIDDKDDPQSGGSSGSARLRARGDAIAAVTVIDEVR
ncbi:hypothetical protein [Brevundimonas sp. PAMC22021]|uniref:hypothetical protein n=1 Tax=Brevundimonas sp. PAMC22021 TaxID=2861285 RepID=UPI001C628963|nr:hypothetical protein [Brevundimonas sp. PAMC22021]QYF87031.1 hypothetical protein KY493_00430 [Brevundimonas sp. PAMC22021]